MDIMIVVFWLQRDARMVTSRLALEASNPVVGSSRKSKMGWVRSSVATETRRFSPPDMPRISSLPAIGRYIGR